MTHTFGVRSDSVAFHDENKKFFKYFFEYLDQKDIRHVIQTGDLFDRRKFISFNSLYLSKQYFFNEFARPDLSSNVIVNPTHTTIDTQTKIAPLWASKHEVRLYTYPGNHDCYYKNTLEVNSLNLLLQEYTKHSRHPYIKICSQPETLNFDGVPIDFIPWICADNEKEIASFIQSTTSQLCFGHFEIAGFEMDKNNVCLEGMKREYLSRYEMVISGHFHHRSTDGHIFYVGAPAEHTWSDYDDARGFHIFDTVSRTLEFIPNPFKMFHKVMYDDSVDNLETIQQKDFTHYKNTMLKVVVIKKDNPIVFDAFMDKLYKEHPIEITIVEDFTDYSSISEEDLVDQADDTTVILDKAIESMNLTDAEKIKRMMRDIYNEAQNAETK